MPEPITREELVEWADTYENIHVVGRLIAEVERLRARVEALEAMAYPDWNAIGDDRDA